jgi:hypothetical protein
MSNVDLLNEIRSAQAEIALWPEWKKVATQLEGTDIYFEKEQRRSISDYSKQREEAPVSQD